jgi:hypothetical protein
MNHELKAAIALGAGLLNLYVAVRGCQLGLKTGQLPFADRFEFFPRPVRKKNPVWFWFNYSSYLVLGCLSLVIILWSIAQFLHIGLTLRSTRTQPQAAGSCHPGGTFTFTSLISSAAAGPVSCFR